MLRLCVLLVCILFPSVSMSCPDGFKSVDSYLSGDREILDLYTSGDKRFNNILHRLYSFRVRNPEMPYVKLKYPMEVVDTIIISDGIPKFRYTLVIVSKRCVIQVVAMPRYLHNETIGVRL